MINNNDVVELELIIRDNNTKELLDTTLEDVAKKENTYNSNISYKPLVIVFGKKELLKIVEENIKDLNKDQEKTFSLTLEQAFGKRDPKNIQLIPFKEFKSEKINPVAGMHITFKNRSGKILSVSGGRVQVDFNHDFAGKDLEYTIKIKEIYSDDNNKFKALVNKYFYFIPSEQLKINLDLVCPEIILPKTLPQEIEYFKYSFVELALEVCNFKNIKFSQIYSKSNK
jgi:FKBP-type peptidyl-prolyl cis-trans isomerase 2